MLILFARQITPRSLATGLIKEYHPLSPMLGVRYPHHHTCNRGHSYKDWQLVIYSYGQIRKRNRLSQPNLQIEFGRNGDSPSLTLSCLLPNFFRTHWSIIVRRFHTKGLLSG